MVRRQPIFNLSGEKKQLPGCSHSLGQSAAKTTREVDEQRSDKIQPTVRYDSCDAAGKYDESSRLWLGRIRDKIGCPCGSCLVGINDEIERRLAVLPTVRIFNPP